MSYEQKILEEEQNSSLHNFVDALVEEQLAEAAQEIGNFKQIELLSRKDCSQDSFQPSSLYATKFALSLPSKCANENNGIYGLLQNRQSVLRMLTGALLLWSITHLIRYSLLSAKSVTIREAAPPTPFFKNSSAFLQDFFDGGIDEMQILMSRAEFTIVMLYSPWDARCKEFRRPFRQIAASFKKLKAVKFVAANCNYYRGICRRKYKLLSFPVIFALTPYRQPVVFNQALSSDRLFTWILHLLSPFHALHSFNDFQLQLARSDFLIVGHFALQYPKFPLPRPYNVFLNAIYKAADMRAQLAFATIIDPKLASQMEFTGIAQLQFYIFYEMKVMATFDIDVRTKSVDIIGWANRCIQQFGTRGVSEIELEDVEAPGKLQTLYQKLNSSVSTLVLFTNSIGLAGHSTASMIALKNLAKIYNFCPIESENFNPAAEFQPTELKFYFNELQQKCTVNQEEPPNMERNWRRRKGDKKTFSSEKHSKNGNGGNWRHQMDCKFWQLIRKGHRDIYREYSSISIVQTEHRRTYNWQKAIDEFAKESTLSWLIGAGCRLNTTLGFMAMDKRFSRYFIRKWGGPTQNSSQMPLHVDSAAIISMGKERIFWKEEPINLITLARFISNFANGTLEWTPANERVIKSSEQEERMHGFPISQLGKLNLAMFDAHQNENRTHDAVILFSGGDWHGPSRTVMHFFHQVQHYFQEFRELIQFFILDTSKNELPWEYNFERLPMVVFLPTGSARESHIFPPELALTMPNLMGFLLPRCQPKLRWLLALSICRPSVACLTQNMNRIVAAMRRMRQEIQTLWWLIDRRQRKWRRMQRSKTIALINGDGLQNLKAHLKRRRLQLATLARMFHLVGSLQNPINNNDEMMTIEKAAKEAEFLTFFLADGEQIF